MSYERLNKLIDRVLREFTDGELIAEFAEDLVAQGISSDRVVSYLYKLISIKRLNGKDFEEWSKEDVRRVILHFQGEVEKGVYSVNTLREIKKTLKKFFKWMDRGELVDWFSLGKSETNVSPQDLITEEEFRRLMDACSCSRDRALISLFYETGARRGEILSMRIKDVSFDDYGAVVWLPRSKTLRRRLRVVYSAPHLAQWIQDHPLREPESPLWICLTNNHGKQLDNEGLYTLLRRLRKRAGIKKRIYPHLFRHTRATRLLAKVPESVGAKFLGWVPGSKMVKVYVHLSQEDVEEKILELYGISQGNNGKDLEIRQCPRCMQINDGVARFCSRCGLPLTEEAVKEVESWEKREAESVRDIDALLEIAKVKERLRELEEMLRSKF
jgi:integrase